MSQNNKKLYPPNIEGTIPAFYGTVLTVPFSMNKTVAQQDVYGMEIKIKAVQSGAYILTDLTTNVIFDPSYQATFDFTENASRNKLKIGQHYKVQIAYIANDENKTVGYFSTVAVIKYTAEPTVLIDGLQINEVNAHKYNYIGLYKNSNDTSEKVYSYCFNLYDNNNIIQTSGETIHNSESDMIDLKESHDIYTIEQDLKINKTYFLEYIITTTNGLKKSSGKYRIVQKMSIDPEIKANVIPELNFENGYVNIKLIGQKNIDGFEYAATGTFKILRASEEDNYETWNEILKFALYGQQPSRWSWKDFTVKQGTTYRYALQQYNNFGLVSNRLESNPIYVDFEHAFLYDGTYQLKIKYNPKITNFKNNILESKLNTIGSQHPFIFRNGNVKYKEFAISGLISCQMDDEFLFTSENDFKYYDYSSNLTGGNISSEREFKLKVLEWLNNGEPKLFRSPTEGNYIVRLMNVSLTPNDQVGRMLHTFNSTAYEIAECTYKNLSEFGLISIENFTFQQLHWETIELDKLLLDEDKKNILNYKAVSLHFENMIPGEKLYIDDGIYHQDISNGKSGFQITIGSTGNYNIDLQQGINVTTVYFIDSDIIQHQGTLTYAYYSKSQNRFDSISDITVLDIPLEQYFGYHNIIEEIENVKTQIQCFYWIHCMLRDIQKAYYKNGNYYKTEECKDILEFDPYTLYHITNLMDQSENNQYLLDGFNLKEYNINDYSSKIYINGNEMDLEKSLAYTIKNPQNIKSFSTGNGIITEIAYQKQIVNYIVESDIINFKNLVELKAISDNAYDILKQAIYDPDSINSNKTIEQYRQEYEEAYNNFLIELEQVLIAKEAAQSNVI